MVQEINLELENLFHPSMINNPYPAYKLWRENDPIHWNPLFNTWILTRYKDMLAVLQDPRFSNTRQTNAATFATLSPEQRQAVMVLLPYLSMFMQGMDGPAHARQRALIQKSFTPRTVERMRPRTQEIVNELIAVIETKSDFDFMRDFAFPLPAAVILEMLGVPRDGHDIIRRSSETIALFTSLTLSMQFAENQIERMAQTIHEAEAYILPLLAERRAHPTDDLISQLIQVEHEGERLSEKELLVITIMLLFAGHETTANILGNGLLALLTHQDQWELLKSDPTLVNSTIEELLRYCSSIQMVPRFPTEDVVLDGYHITKDQPVMVCFAAANHDPEVYPNPEVLDITRKPQRILTFGHGVHYCVGSALAKMESQIALSTLIQRLPNLQLTSATPQWVPVFALRGLQTLPMKRT